MLIHSRDGCLEVSSRTMSDSKVDTVITTETNITKCYTKYCIFYNIVATKSKVHRVGVSVLYRTHPNFQLGHINVLVLNSMIMLLTTGNQHWKIYGIYIPMGNDHSNLLKCEEILYTLRLIDKNNSHKIASYLSIWGLEISVT